MGVKTLLLKPIEIPRKIEMSLPAGVPSVSGLMEKVANSLPDLGGSSMGLSSIKLPKVTPIISRVEENLPMLPKISLRAQRLEAPAIAKIQELLGKDSVVQSAPTGLVQLVFE